jgi:GMP synthase (glutamine-hydrolysing)
LAIVEIPCFVTARQLRSGNENHFFQPVVRMKELYIIKVGTTYASTADRFGDFDDWTVAGLGLSASDVRVLDVEHGAVLPATEECSAAVITGSHAMVTDDLPWSVKTEQWISSLLEARVPVLGICYGHQLLARAAGGQVGFHPDGREIGIVQIHLLPDAADDPLFQSFPSFFAAQVSHSQTVLSLPPGAVPLAANRHEPHHAIRVGDCAWGLQFHPEFDSKIMRLYIMAETRELLAEGRNVAELLQAVSETQIAAGTLRNFARFVREQR